MANSLGKTLINIDKLPYKMDKEMELSVNEGLYSSFKQNYIKKEGSPQLHTIQILANRLKDF